MSNATRTYRVTVRRNGRTVLSLHLYGLSSALVAVRRLRTLWTGYAVHLARV